MTPTDPRVERLMQLALVMARRWMATNHSQAGEEEAQEYRIAEQALRLALCEASVQEPKAMQEHEFDDVRCRMYLGREDACKPVIRDWREALNFAIAAIDFRDAQWRAALDKAEQ